MDASILQAPTTEPLLVTAEQAATSVHVHRRGVPIWRR